MPHLIMISPRERFEYPTFLSFIHVAEVAVKTQAYVTPSNENC